MATSSTFNTPLSAFNRTTTAAARFPSKITAAYATSKSINRSSSSTSHYEILGIQTSATYQEIKQAYRKLARLSHPDVVSTAVSPSAYDFIKIHSAYATLSDPAKRADYDRTVVGKTTSVRSFEMNTTTYGYARAADSKSFGCRRWETDQCW